MSVSLPPIKWRESPNESARRAPVRLVVVHRPVGSYAGSIKWLCTPTKYDSHGNVISGPDASAHVIVNDAATEATQLVTWQRKAWACGSFNSPSDNIETPDNIWLEPLTAARLHAMHVCARIVAFRLHERGLPARWVRKSAVADGRGFTRHYDLGAAGGGHTDPTESTVRWQAFVALVQHELARGGFRPSWGR